MDEDIFWAKDSLQNREWELLGNSMQLIKWNYNGPDSPDMSLELVLDIQRRYSTHFAAVVIVAIGKSL